MAEKEIFGLNIKAIKTLKDLESLDDNAFFVKKWVEEAKSSMSAYSGFGGCTKAFYRNKDGTGAYQDWKDEAKALIDLLTEPEYKSARSSVQNAFYTPESITQKIYDQLNNIGASNKQLDIFEPGCGTGNFLSLMPKDFKFSSYTGLEYDSITARIATQLYRADENINIFVYFRIWTA